MKQKTNTTGSRFCSCENIRILVFFSYRKHFPFYSTFRLLAQSWLEGRMLIIIHSLPQINLQSDLDHCYLALLAALDFMMASALKQFLK